MTVIVAGVIRNRVVIGADTRTTLDDDATLANIKESKLVRFKNGFVVGAAGLGAVTETLWTLANQDIKITNRASVLAFVKKFWQTFDEIEENPDKTAEMLICTKSNIFHALNKSGVAEMNGFWAVGTGKPYALGALECCYGDVSTIGDLERAIKRAMTIACKYQSDCGEPLDCMVV